MDLDKNQLADRYAENYKGIFHSDYRKAFIAGHESRDAEVEGLKRQLDNCWSDRGSYWKDEYAKACGQRDFSYKEIKSLEAERDRYRGALENLKYVVIDSDVEAHEIIDPSS